MTCIYIISKLSPDDALTSIPASIQCKERDHLILTTSYKNHK